MTKENNGKGLSEEEMHCNCSHLLKPSSFRKNQTQRDGDRTTGLPQMIVTEGRLISFPLLRSYELKTRM